MAAAAVWMMLVRDSGLKRKKYTEMFVTIQNSKTVSTKGVTKTTFTKNTKQTKIFNPTLAKEIRTTAVKGCTH